MDRWFSIYGLATADFAADQEEITLFRMLAKKANDLTKQTVLTDIPLEWDTDDLCINCNELINAGICECLSNERARWTTVKGFVHNHVAHNLSFFYDLERNASDIEKDKSSCFSCVKYKTVRCPSLRESMLWCFNEMENANYICNEANIILCDSYVPYGISSDLDAMSDGTVYYQPAFTEEEVFNLESLVSGERD